MEIFNFALTDWLYAHADELMVGILITATFTVFGIVAKKLWSLRIPTGRLAGTYVARITDQDFNTGNLLLISLRQFGSRLTGYGVSVQPSRDRDHGLQFAVTSHGDTLIGVISPFGQASSGGTAFCVNLADAGDLPLYAGKSIKAQAGSIGINAIEFVRVDDQVRSLRELAHQSKALLGAVARFQSPQG